ncbi:5-(carboxyamino)imidazole ribonucleotide synthase [Burkholderiaceae bacterium FT117]|uniref:5-(carboxyamino)imidazole ribonucleotide synthase n=1 Tax=Zeimonas sediminis TaxID=2944268 RepID=UPI0023431B59|nr:5-(carboxyamino)imidazole ribonucleotide synthase [Zeimonas sediminis]MCM5570224.1 5-(carboxyamino)imidazole ribonucleotide synthase [Zeimonas sediminis]
MAGEQRPAGARRVPVPPLPPGSWLGMLGGGQLGRMFCMAAQSLGYKVCVLDPAADSPAGSVADRHLRADYLDEAALDELGRLCGAVTTEFENVPAKALDFLAQRCVVSPAGSAVAVAQDRIVEKAFVRDCGIDTAPYAPVRSADELRAVDPSLFPGILKAARLGYDGKGQATVASVDEALAAFESFGGVPCVLEKRLALDLEVSVIVARGFDGKAVAYPVSENVHVGGILATSTVPARISQDVAARAEAATRRIAEALDYVGVLCVEFFVLADGSLLVNEMAPRPHNSGHYTIDACVTSQFEQQARAMAGLPLGSTRQHQQAVMVNLLGDCWVAAGGEPPWAEVLAHPEARLHLYGKAEARAGRKMGHVTVVADTLAHAIHVAGQVAQAVGAAR